MEKMQQHFNFRGRTTEQGIVFSRGFMSHNLE